MDRTYAHSSIVWLFGPGTFALCLSLTYILLTAEEALIGKVSLNASLCGLWLLGASVLWFWFRTGLTKYVATEEGLLVKRLFAHSFHPWASITRLDENVILHYVVVRGSSGTIAFTSTDCFPRLPDLLRVIYERSGCELSRTLQDLLLEDSQPFR